MPRKYARGDNAVGICGRSGRKMLLRDMVFDGRYPNMRVDPEWYEGKHPQEEIVRVDDPVALYRPAPPNFDSVAPQISAVFNGANIDVTWTAGSSDEGIILSYTLFRSLDDGSYTEVGTFPVVRDWEGRVISTPLSYTQVGFLGGVTYRFYVVANGGIFSLASNIAEAFQVVAVEYVLGSTAQVDPSTPTVFTSPQTINWTEFPIGSPIENCVAVISFCAITLSPTGPTSVTFGGIAANIQHNVSPREPSVIVPAGTEYLHMVQAIVPLQSLDTTTLPNRNVIITWPEASTYLVQGTMRAFRNVSTASNNFGSGSQTFNGTLDTGDLPLTASINVPQGGAVVVIGAVNTGNDANPAFLTNAAKVGVLAPDYSVLTSATANLAGGFTNSVAHREYPTAVPAEIVWMRPGQAIFEAGFGRAVVLAPG